MTIAADGSTANQGFTDWRPLVRIALGDLPCLGDVAAVYAIRSRDGKVLYIGSTKNLRNRLFKNYIGGTGGETTMRIHRLLFAQGHIAEVEFAWLETGKYRQMEEELKQNYREKHGQLPRWTRR